MPLSGLRWTLLMMPLVAPLSSGSRELDDGGAGPALRYSASNVLGVDLDRGVDGFPLAEDDAGHEAVAA